MITSGDGIFNDVIMDCQSDTGTYLFCMQRNKNLREINYHLFSNIEQFPTLLIESKKTFFFLLLIDTESLLFNVLKCNIKLPGSLINWVI